MDDIASHITTGAMLVYDLEYLKRAGWCLVHHLRGRGSHAGHR